MRAYVFQAALLCEACGKAQQTKLDQIATAWGNAHFGYREDSDRYPQGPYKDGGGEADTPQHCDHCGTFLENPLTKDGRLYVEEQIDALPVSRFSEAGYTYEELARIAESCEQFVLAEWIRFYFAYGQ
jgi:hypothetical protein